MIKVQKLIPAGTNNYLVQAFADTKSEVTNSAKFVGFPEGATMEMGSSVLTAAGEVAFKKSDGSWSWV